jgi:hypothetical protein
MYGFKKTFRDNDRWRSDTGILSTVPGIADEKIDEKFPKYLFTISKHSELRGMYMDVEN